MTTTLAPTVPNPLLTTRPSPAEALRQYGLVVQWQFRRAAPALPLLVLVQIMLAVATIVGYGLLVGTPDRVAGLYLATGAPTVVLIMVGLVMTPQFVGQSRTEGSLDWFRTLPVPRLLFLLADLTMWTLIALPGVVLGAVAGSVRFQADLSPTWWLVPAALVVSLTSASIGYAMATVLTPMIAQLMSQVLLFLVLLFTPISFPADRMPHWAQQIHAWLPLEPMAEVIRAGLAPHEFTVPGRSWTVLLIWCAICLTGAAFALHRRR